MFEPVEVAKCRKLGVSQRNQKSWNIDFRFTTVKNSNLWTFCLENKSMAEYVDEGLKRIGITISKPMRACMLGFFILFKSFSLS